MNSGDDRMAGIGCVDGLHTLGAFHLRDGHTIRVDGQRGFQQLHKGNVLLGIVGKAGDKVYHVIQHISVLVRHSQVKFTAALFQRDNPLVIGDLP